jgi:hypothetical protein
VQPNDRSDVALVQLLINRIMRVKRLRDSRRPFNPGPDDPLSGRVHGYPPLDFLDVDGWFGPETANAITTYQATSPGCLVRDGVISPVHPLLASGAIPFEVKKRAILQLNAEGLETFGKDARRTGISAVPALEDGDLSNLHTSLPAGAEA